MDKQTNKRHDSREWGKGEEKGGKTEWGKQWFLLATERPKGRKYIYREHMGINDSQFINFQTEVLMFKSGFLRGVKTRIFGLYFRKQTQIAIESLYKQNSVTFIIHAKVYEGGTLLPNGK